MVKFFLPFINDQLMVIENKKSLQKDAWYEYLLF